MLEGVKKIGHVGLAVRDLDRAVDFYCDVLGLDLTERFEYPEDEVGHGVAVRAGAFLRCSSTHHCLSIFVLKDELDGPPPGTVGYGLHHIAFEIATPEQLLARYRDFKARGVEIVNAREGGPGNQPRFYARDPDGNLLEFYWGIDEIGWDGRAREYQPITEIELEDFDFEQFVEARRVAADAARVR
ncbi:MAG: VOC family protein [Actinobacteria bacterium]|nr:VOC family protein [Actinomycetota bacterium]